MSLDRIRYFVETARHEHIGKAASILRVSPSAISHSIAALESELGRELFYKKGRRIGLTDSGQAFLERAARILEEYDRLKEDIGSDKIGFKGLQRIAASHLLCSSLVAPAWTKVARDHPGLVAEILTLRSAQVLEGVLAGHVDLGFCFSPQDHPDLETALIVEGQMHVAVAKRHPVLSLPAGKQLQALHAYPAALPKAFQGIEVCVSHPMFAKLAWSPDPRYMFDSYDVALELVRSSDAWSLLPDIVLDTSSSRLAMIKHPKTWDAPYRFSAVWPKHRRLSAPLRLLIEGMKAIGRG